MTLEEEVLPTHRELTTQQQSIKRDALDRSGNVKVGVVLTGPRDQSMIALYTDLLDPVERRRANAFKRSLDRRCYVATHLLARIVLYEAGLVGRNDWPVVTDPRGKPRLISDTGHERGFFSLAHSGSAGACACSPSPVGIDIEFVSWDLEVELLARSVLSPSEKRQIEVLGSRDRVRAFLRCWTAKEALSKANGMGLGIGFEQLTFDVSCKEYVTLLDGPPPPESD